MSRTQDSLAIIIPWANRQEIEHSLRANCEVFRAPGTEVIVANCAGERAFVRRLAREVGLPQLRVLEIAAASFNKSLAINLAARAARSDALLVLDNDILIPAATLAALRRAATRRSFATVASVLSDAPAREAKLSSLGHYVRIRPRGGRAISVETSGHAQGGAVRSGPGLICVTRAAFIAVAGMNSALHGWGWEDVDLIVRLQLALGLRRYQRGSVRHVRADTAGRPASTEQRAATQTENVWKALASYMAGDLKGTFPSDTRHWQQATRLLQGPHYS